MVSEDSKPTLMNGGPVENGMSEDPNNKTNLIINYLPSKMSQDEIKNLFASCGNITSCKLVRDKNSGQSLGYAFVNFDDPDHARKAIDELNGLRLQNKRIKVSFARPSSQEIKGANLYISGLPKRVSQDELEEMFHSFGTIITTKVLTDDKGESRGAGFIRFDKRSQAQAAIDTLNDKTPPGYEQTVKLTVKFANTPKPNQQIPMMPFESPITLAAAAVAGRTPRSTAASFGTGVGPMHHQGVNVRYSPFCPTNHANSLFAGNNVHPLQSWCIFVYGLSPEDDEKTLYQLFSPFGAITDVRVKTDKGYGFVNMRNYDEACQAILAMNHYQHNSKPLQVNWKTPTNKKSN